MKSKNCRYYLSDDRVGNRKNDMSIVAVCYDCRFFLVGWFVSSDIAFAHIEIRSIGFSAPQKNIPLNMCTVHIFIAQVDIFSLLFLLACFNFNIIIYFYKLYFIAVDSLSPLSFCECALSISYIL